MGLAIYYSLLEQKYHKKIKPVARRKESDIPLDYKCLSCQTPIPYFYRNKGQVGQLKCKVCDTNFSPNENRFSKQYTLLCPHYNHALSRKKNRKHFIFHKCANPKCSYYLHNLKRLRKSICNRTMVKIDISSTISTVNS